jgi:hypothetical protein
VNRTVGLVIVLLVVLGLAIYINAQRQAGPDLAGWHLCWPDPSPDERGWFGEIELVVIKDGKITEVRL